MRVRERSCYFDLPYLALTSVFRLIRLLPANDVDKNIEILALRHRLAILQRVGCKYSVKAATWALILNAFESMT